MQILVNLSSNRAITLHLLTIGLCTLNVCPMKSLFKRRNCRVIDDRNTADWITDWLGLYILKDLLWFGYQSLRTYEYVLHDTKPFLLAKTNSYFHKNTKLAFFSTGWIVHCWFSLYKYWVVIKLPVSVSVSLNRSLNKFNKYEKKKKTGLIPEKLYDNLLEAKICQLLVVWVILVENFWRSVSFVFAQRKIKA